MWMRDKQVESFIRRLQIKVPVDIVGIAKVLGLQVYESHALPEGIAGKIFRDREHGGQGGYSIVVRGADPYVRKRFTVAHEIAHYLLHKHLFYGDELVDNALYRSQLSGKLEAQANALAADLLMPWHLLSPMIGNSSSLDLAQQFEVSEQAMKIRLESQGTTPQFI
jgi:Zn-dependent peptidase ImmA (M78 family)